MPANNYAPEDFELNGYGLVPVEIQISEAGAGLIKGEVRGVSPDVAAAMCNLGTAKAIKITKEIKAATDADIKASADASAARDALARAQAAAQGNKLPGM